MDEQEYERDERLLEARRLKRLELRRKRVIRSRIFYGVILLVLVVIIVLIVRSCGKEEAVADPVTPETTPPVTLPVEKPDQTATLSAVGDIMVYDQQLDDAKQTDGTYNFLPSLAPVAELLAASDLTVGNFEANFGEAPYSGYPNFIAPPALATTLAGVGFDILQTANTYSIQNGLSGLSSTIRAIREAGMNTLGTYLSADDKTQNRVIVKEVNGIKFAFIGFTKGLNNLRLPEGSGYCVDLLYTDYDSTYNKINKTAILESTAAAVASGADVIVSMVHWGSEYDVAASASQKEIADLLIQNGVDVILGTHSHIVGPMETRKVTVDGKEKEVFIAYSLGNFLSAMKKDNVPALNDSVILNLSFTKDGDTGETTISSASYVPLYIRDNGEAAADRFEVVDISKVLNSGPDAITQELMEGALRTLSTNTGISVSVEPPAADPAAPDANATANTANTQGGTAS